jgi:hypothetical protein
MSKQGAKKDPVEQARRKLAKAKLKWNVADERLAQARVEGRQEVEKARLREAQLLAKATERLQRRSIALAEAEKELLSLTGGKGLELEPSSPEAAADEVAQRQAEAADEIHTNSIVSPDSSEVLVELDSESR